MSNQRKLLPYEYQLVEALGITKEDYLEFVAQQHIYTDVKEGTVLDSRNDFTVVALVLTIVGILFQVAAVLLAPKPDKGRPGSKDEVFAPRFGFNSVQELARYGDTVNLVYANYDNQTKEGGVRVATSLLWSAVQSYGNSQLVQLLLVIGAGGIGAIDPARSAFGQTGMRDLVAQNYWLYFAPGRTGALRNADLLPDPYGALKTADPTRFGGPTENPYRLSSATTGAKQEGFSHAYSPASANTFGLYGVLPININYRIRKASGSFAEASNKITISKKNSTSRGWPSPGTPIAKGEIYEITLAQIPQDIDEGSVADREAAESRQALSSVFDNSGVIKIGAAVFKIINVNRSNVIDGPLIAEIQCIEKGSSPSVEYNVTQPGEVDVIASLNSGPEYDRVRAISLPLLAQDDRTVPTGKEIVQGGPVIGIKKFNEERELNAIELAEKGDIYEYKVVKKKAKKSTTLSSTVTELVKVRSLTDKEKDALNLYYELDNAINDASLQDDFFYLKAAVRIERANYETISLCNIVDFSIKARIFKRISGRTEKYGTKEKKGWKTSDNGIKSRTAMFMLKYKKPSDNDYRTVPGIFVVRRTGDIENYAYLRFNSGTSSIGLASHWQFLFEPVADPLSESRSNPALTTASGRIVFHYLENSPDKSKPNNGVTKVSLPNGAFIEYSGSSKIGTMAGFPPVNVSPRGLNEWDLFTATSDEQIQFSFDNGPEFSIAAVTEQIIDNFSNYKKLYEDLSLVGLNMYSGKSVQDLRSFSVFVTQGRRCRLLRTSGTVNNIPWGQPNYQYLFPSANGFANTAPDIFIDTALDPNDGVGQYASIDSLNIEQLARSKKFCEVNKLFMDGVIADPSSWREFWSSTAGFSLLELAKIGGQDTLLPAVPYDRTTGAITTIVPVVALFNPGNILEDSYKEEFIDYGSSTQDVIVTAIYRSLDSSGMFPIKKSVDIQLTNTVEENAIKETLDLSNFVTRRDQAILVAKFLCQSRRHSRRAVEFKTFPTDSPVFPGAYVYVELAQNQWNNIYTGIIESGGSLNMPSSPSIANGTYSALCYKPGNKGTVSLADIQVVDGKAAKLTGYAGHLFVLGTVLKNKRVFKVTEVMMDEEGEVTIRGIEHATDTSGNSLISRGLATKVNGLFLIDGRPE
jgi:hypothetical protein